MRHITVIDGHPDPSPSHLIHALADRYAYAAQAEGNEVRRVTLASVDFPLLRSSEDFYHAAAPPALEQAQRDIAWAEHLVFFFPLWHGTMPALFKAFVEQTFRPGFAMDYGGARRLPKKLFTGKSARIVMTMGMPAFIYRSYFGAYALKGFERSTLQMCGIGPIAETLIGGAAPDAMKSAPQWLERMTVLAREDGAPEEARRSRMVATAARAALMLGASYAAYVLGNALSRSWFQAPPKTPQRPVTEELQPMRNPPSTTSV